jgi:hypothetical protein
MFPAWGACDILRVPIDGKASPDPHGSQCRLASELTLLEESKDPRVLLGI